MQVGTQLRNELSPVDRTSSGLDYLREIWARRDYLAVVPRQDARARQMTTALGQAWHLLNPILMTLIYFVVFGLVLDARRGVEHYIAFLTIGILVFQLVQRITQEAAGTIPKHQGLIRTINFPRALLPLATVTEQVVAFIPSIAVMYVVVFANGAPLSLRMLLLPVALIPTVLLATGAAFLTSRLGATIPDLREILPHAFRLLFYSSGVLFSIEELINNETAKTILRLNPILGVVDVARWAALGTSLHPLVIVSVVIWCSALPIIGLAWFRRGEIGYGA